MKCLYVLRKTHFLGVRFKFSPQNGSHFTCCVMKFRPEIANSLNAGKQTSVHAYCVHTHAYTYIDTTHTHTHTHLYRHTDRHVQYCRILKGKRLYFTQGRQVHTALDCSYCTRLFIVRWTWFILFWTVHTALDYS
jgi:hypothetical protein